MHVTTASMLGVMALLDVEPQRVERRRSAAGTAFQPAGTFARAETASGGLAGAGPSRREQGRSLPP